MTSRAIGICLGASTIKTAELLCDGDTVRVGETRVLAHDSNPRGLLERLAGELVGGGYDYGVITGRKLRYLIDARSIAEPEAVESALALTLRLQPSLVRPRAIASLGAESFVVYLLDEAGHISTVETGNKCASGTGEFFLQQIGRMDITVDEAVRLSEGSEKYRVSGRCTVFCKSDCTHALNKGVPIGRVTAGLAEMTADKVLDLLSRQGQRDVLAVGGVTRNAAIMAKLAERISGLTVPDHADVFEALGAAWYAYEQRVPWSFAPGQLFLDTNVSFERLPPIAQGEALVRFASALEAKAAPGDVCVVGLDVGSTTTKAVALRLSDDAVVASVYLRTSGNPIAASRACYADIARQLPEGVLIIALGTTGSGRQVAGLHAGTDAVINEIIAHATGAAYFDKDVDTIFEIGGQDAKYTHLTAGVPSDYAMNEACSAGTGSFLEEAAKESMGLGTLEIAAEAMKGDSPPNFNDQCAAFISSDIKTAVHEGVGKEDIVAGLVYSVCQNYLNRVKGARAVGKKVFMQGGVCYNRAVPLAMAVLLGKEIIVPPSPGLIGAFGVALEVKERLDRGALVRSAFDLRALAAREVEHGKTFICHGKAEHCDRGCEISMMMIDGKKHPFGGACNKYYNQVHHITANPTDLDYVARRQELVFEIHGVSARGGRPTVGINRTFLVNRFYPLFSTYFDALGCDPVLSDAVDPDGVKHTRAAFCYPAEIAHGAFANLLSKQLDYVFLPKIYSLPVTGGNTDRKFQASCLLLQSEAYWLLPAFQDAKMPTVLAPQLDLNEGLLSKLDVFAALATQLGRSIAEGETAYRRAIVAQQACDDAIKELGQEALARLVSEPWKRAVVLFGRPYNAFAKEANLAIPAKLASRGVAVIPWDALPFEQWPIDPDINWALGQDLLRATKLVAANPRLFGAFVTNFSCGPDSFLVGYFRDLLGQKPSLTLELDSHSADAGINTRIEAFLDIVDKHMALGADASAKSTFVPARIEFEQKKAVFVTSAGEHVPLTDPRVHLVFPSMGALGTELLAAVFRGLGVHATGLPVPDHEVLKLGRGNTSCKECLPLLLVTGGLLQYLARREREDELLTYFMPTSGGGCRLTQYSVFLRKLVAKNELKNVALLSLTNTNGYAGLMVRDILNVLKAVIVSDVMEDIRSALRVLAVDRTQAEAELSRQWRRILACFEKHHGNGIYGVLDEVSQALRTIPLRRRLQDAPTVIISGEMYVRRDYFSCQDLMERLAERGIVALRAHVNEYLSYSDYNVDQAYWENKVDKMSFGQKAEHRVKTMLGRAYEHTVKRSLARSGLYHYEMLDIPKIVEYGKGFFDPRFTGEAFLSVGTYYKDILHSAHGVVSIGPFACMQARVAEAVITPNTALSVKRQLDERVDGCSHVSELLKGMSDLPFLAIESDGNPFPQIVDARLEVFCLQVERLFGRLHGQPPSSAFATMPMRR